MFNNKILYKEQVTATILCARLVGRWVLRKKGEERTFFEKVFICENTLHKIIYKLLHFLILFSFSPHNSFQKNKIIIITIKFYIRRVRNNIQKLQ